MNLKNCQFYCPYCKAHLSQSGEIALTTKSSGKELGTMMLSVSIGDYTYKHIPKMEFSPGEVLDFCCPHCKEDLSSDNYENFARLIMKVSKDVEFELLFSRKAGKRKTYIITEDGIESYSGR